MEDIDEKCKTCQFHTRTYSCEGKPEACQQYRSQEDFDKGCAEYYASKHGSDNYTGD